MAEATQQTSTEQPASTEQSLDDVYKEFNVEAEASNFHEQAQTQQHQRQQQKTEVAVPDPVLDQAGFKTFLTDQNQSVETLKQALSEVNGKLNAVTVERLRAKEEADIKSAVQKFKSIAGDEVDDLVAEVTLGAQVRRDPKFLTVYRNRDKNPAAWDKAVSALATTFKSKNQFRVDPQLAENQRAAKQSIGSQSRQTQEEPTGDEARFKGKTGSAFQREWRNYVDGG